MTFGRVVAVRVAGLVISSPRIWFEVGRSADRTSDRATVEIYNLASGTQEQVYERAGPVSLSAGYEGMVGELFSGQVQHVRQPRRVGAGVARITRIECGDLNRSINAVSGVQPLGGMTSRSYDGPESLRGVLRDLASDMGLTLGPLDAVPDTTVSNWSFAGEAADAVTVLLGAVGRSWWEDGGVLRVRRRGDAGQSDAPRFLVSPGSGLIGAPVPTDEGCEIVTFLNPGLRVGSFVRLESDTKIGDYTTGRVDASGRQLAGVVQDVG